MGEPVEHAAGADRGQLRRVADRDELRSTVGHRPGEPVEAIGVTHTSLIEVDRRRLVDLQLSAVYAGDERVEGERLSFERGAVLAEPLRGGARDGDPERAAAGELLGARGGVDHDALAGARGADENRPALGACDDPERVGLLVGEASADALSDPIGSERPRLVAHVPAGWVGEPGEAPLDRLLACPDRERR